MRQRSQVRCLLLVALFTQTLRANAQDRDTDIYRLSVAVDEVVLTFHAADTHDLPINDLKLGEFSLLDNGRPPRRVLDFKLLKDFPIRAGIVMDTSESMSEHLRGNRAVAIQYAQKILRQQTDQAFVMDFGRVSKTRQPWTSDPNALSASIRNITLGGERRIPGTAIFDTIFLACYSTFGKIDHAASSNFIMLFTDGEDNASSVTEQAAVDMCQRNNTAIYAFRADPKSGLSASGPTTLNELTSQTGGRVFRDDESETAIYEDLRIIEADLRNQYRLVYRPAELKHNGSFHRIELRYPQRVGKIAIRSGYYAPAH